MKKLALIILLIASFCGLKAQDYNLTIVSYNIRNGMGMDEVTNLDRTAKVINHVQPDLLAVQEVDSMTGRNKLDVLKVLGAKTNMYHSYAPAIEFDGGKYGVGLLSKEKPLGMRYIALPGREEERVLLVVEFEKYVMMCTHLSLTAEDQLSSISMIEREAKKYTDKVVFIAGDFNAHPNSDVIEGFEKTFKIVSNAPEFTYPADEPNECIDYVMAYGEKYNFDTKFNFVYKELLASDHRPIVVGVSVQAK